MPETTKRERYKIEFADVRLTPEQLKATEDKINQLESALEDYKFQEKRIVLFLEKLSRISQLDPQSINMAFKSDKDYEMILSNNFGEDTVKFYLKQKP